MKKAFTMLELIMVIVVIGILAAVMLPRVGSDKLAEAATQVVAHIRYTQHLAMVDDRYGQVQPGNNNWFISRWQILFHLDSGNNVYSIYSDSDLNDSPTPANVEMAIDPLTRNLMTGSAIIKRVPNMDLTSTYGITNRTFNNGCAGVQRIFFDHLGRPHTNNNTLFGDLLTADCEIVLTNSEGNVTITIEPETGYASVAF